MWGISLVLAVSMLSEPALARESCHTKELSKRIGKHTRDQSPIYNCQVDFNTAKTCCLYPESCGGSSKDAQSMLLQAGAIAEFKRIKEVELGRCEARIKRAKISCHNDYSRKAALNREFNDVILCADDQLAKLNGRVIKNATESRFAYEAENPPPASEAPPSSAQNP